MGYVLLWIESLAVSLLFVATLVACVGRSRRRSVQVALSVLVMLLPLAVYVGLSGLAGFMKYGGMLGTRFYQILALTVCFVIGASWVLYRGLQRGSEGPRQPVAVGWPRCKLAIGLGLAIALHLTTFWNLDLAARQWLAAHRAEAGALALSVAPPRVPDRENAALVYQQAFEVMGPLESWKDTWDEKWNQWARGEAGFDPKELRLREFLEQQTAVLALLRRAAEKPGCYFDRHYARPGAETSVPESQHLMMAARLLSLDGRVKAAEGDLHTALEDVQAMFAMAQHVSSEPILISVLMSIAVERMAADTLEATLGTRQASADELGLLNIDPGVSYSRCLAQAFRMEEALYLSECCQLGEAWPLGTLQPGVNVGPIGTAPLYRVFVFRPDMAALRPTMHELQRLAGLPFHQAKSDWDRLRKELSAGSEGFIGIGNLLHPALTKFAEDAVQGDARHRVVLVALGVCRYRAAHERFPAKLEDLTPELLAAVPRDPFDGKPIRLKRIEGGLVVYSIGPDLADNGGAPWDSKTKTGDVTFRLVDGG